ncbi:MAG: hypothetical protein JXB45_11205 [Candidatus Krumholzibacteriota bacterium]|nr:hypothetical protein [Candidatus Krumholzibacteriota bacterium]
MVEGRIIDCATGKPVELAVIDLFETGAMTLSGADGSFRLPLPGPAARAHISIIHISYHQIPFMEIDPAAGRTPDICLRMQIYQTGAIEVVAASPPSPPVFLERAELDVKLLSRGALSQTDPLYALKDQASVTSGNDFDGRFSIHGSSPDANAFFLDGLLFPSPYHFGGLCSIYDGSNIGKFYFSPVPLSAAAHGATGAVIEVETKDGIGEGVENDFSLGLLSSSISSRRSVVEGTVFISLLARRSYLDLLYGTFSDQKDMQMPNFHDIQANLVKHLDHRQSLRLGLLLSGDETLLSTETMGMEGDGTGTELSWHRRLGALSLSYSCREVDSSPWWGRATLAWQPYRSTFFMSGNDIESMGWYGGRGTLRLDLGCRYRQGMITAGLFSSLSTIEYELNFGRSFWLASRNENSAVRLDNDGYAFQADGMNRWQYTGGYGEITWAGEKTGARVGLRFENFGRSEEVLASPRFSLHRMLDTKTTVLFSGGIFARDPAEDFGNPAAVGQNLLVEKAGQLNLGLSRELPARVRLQAGLFIRRDRDLAVETEPVVYTSGGRGRSKGLELGLEKRFGSWSAVGSYAWMHAQRIDRPHTLTFRPEISGQGVQNLEAAYEAPYWYSSPCEYRHSFSLEGSRQVGEHFKLSFTWKVNSGRPYTPIGTVYQRTSGGYVASEGRRMSARLPAYSRIDIHAEWSYDRAAFFVEVLNITNRRNVFNLRYNENYSDRAYYRMLPLLLGFGVKVTF